MPTTTTTSKDSTGNIFRSFEDLNEYCTTQEVPIDKYVILDSDIDFEDLEFTKYGRIYIPLPDGIPCVNAFVTQQLINKFGNPEASYISDLWFWELQITTHNLTDPVPKGFYPSE